ncbi:MAG: cation diffusion facilitator family transporter [Acidimicrobiales bacterium]
MLVALGINAAVVFVQVFAGFAASSVGLLADAAHNLTDVAAIALAAWAVRLTRRPPNKARTFGYHRSTVLAAQANAAFLFAVTAVIGYEAILRLVHPHPVHGGVIAVVAAAALVANGAAAAVVFERHGTDLNVRSTVVHLAADAAASGGVAVAGLVMFLARGLYWLDPVVSLAIAVLIAVESALLVRDSVDVLLESTPSGLHVEELVAAMRTVSGVEEVHDVHVWALSSEVSALSAHVVLLGHPTLEEAQAVGDAVKSTIAADFGICHATLDLECETCSPGPPRCAMDDLSAAAAAAVHQH